MSEEPAQTRPPRPSGPAPAARPPLIRLALAFLVAAASDLVSYGTAFVPPVQWTVDLVTAVLLFVLLGRRWAILPGLVAEAIPGVAVFPVWLLVVASVALWGEITRPARTPWT
jgi:DNA-binding transcriptional LysR family regulator